MDEPDRETVSTALTDTLRRAVREKHRFFAARAAISAGVLCLALAAVAVLVDIQLAFGPPARWTAFGLLLGALGCMVLARGLLPTLRYREHAAVRDIESVLPSVGQLVRTSADVARHGASRGFSPALSKALMSEAAEAIDELPRDRLIPWNRVRRLGAVLALVAAAFLGTAMLWPDFRKSTVRLALPAAPVTFTQAELLVSAERFERGESIDVHLTVHGRPSDRIQLAIRPLQGEWRRQPLASRSANRWAGTISGWTESFEVKAEAGDDRTEPIRVTFVDPPRVLEATVTLTYPAYTRRPTKTMPLDQVVAIEGTVARYTFELNHALTDAWIEQSGVNQRIPLRAGVPRMTQDITVLPGQHTYRLGGSDAADVALKPCHWRVRGVTDRLPTISFVIPKADVTLTKLGELPIDVLVEDDAGVAEAEIILTIDGSEYTVASVKPSREALRQTHLKHHLMLEDLPVYPGCNMRIHARARDHYPGRRGWGVSDIRLIQVRPLKVLQELPEQQPDEERASAEALREQLATLEEAIEEQKKVLEETLKRREQDPETAEPMQHEAETEKRLAQTMEGLMTQTDSPDTHTQPNPDENPAPQENLGEAMPQSPATQPLARAAEALLQAAEALLKPSIPEAYQREDLAMADMMKARQALREQLEQAMQQQNPGQTSPQQQPRQTQETESLESLAERAAELARRERSIAARTMAELQAATPSPESLQTRRQPSREPPETASTQAADDTREQGEMQMRTAQSDDSQQQALTTPQEPGHPRDNPDTPAAEADDAHAQQARAVAEAVTLERDVAQHPRTTPLAEARMREARERMQEALEALNPVNDPAATEYLSQAERQLSELAHHLRGLDPALAAETLERAARMARGAAEQLPPPAHGDRAPTAEQPYGGTKPQSARQQPPARQQPEAPPETAMAQSETQHDQTTADREQIARQAETMDDWLERLTEAPVQGMEPTQRELSRLREDVQTHTLAEQVRRAQAEHQLGHPEEARRQDADAARRFEQIAESLTAERERLVRSRLEQLAAAEQQARQLQEETSRTSPPQNERNGRTAAEKLRDFADDLQRLHDRELAERAREIRQRVGPLNLTGKPEHGDTIPETVHRETLPGAEGRLRELIDDVVRREMLADRDARIPDAYRPMVDSYFKALSDDQQ